MRIRRSAALALALALALATRFAAGCLDEPPLVVIEPNRRPDPVPPPVVRLAREEAVSVVDLLALPPSEVTAGPLPPVDAAEIPEERAVDYGTLRAKSVVDLQPWRESQELAPGVVLTDLHPRFHRELLLTVNGVTWSLENRAPGSTLVDLARSNEDGIAVIHLADDEVIHCAPWKGAPSELAQAKAAGSPYFPICEDHLLVRTTVEGNRSTLEWATEFVRGKVKGGDHITALVKKGTQDRYRKAAKLGVDEAAEQAASGPLAVRLGVDSSKATIGRGDLGLPVAAPAKIRAGAWLPVIGQPGVYTTALAPRLVELPEDPVNRELVASADEAEGGALVLMVAYDLADFELEFEVGTEHPAVGWSQRAAPAQVDARFGGPDGFGTLAPLGRTGQVPPSEALRLVGVFTGGFKREHAAFKEGELSKVNGASHYGVVQDGVIQSKLQPGLATLVVYAGNKVDIVTWSEARNEQLERVLHARQNGVALLSSHDGQGRVTPLISNWRAGNWSGSATGENRTIRAGACIQESERGRHLIYAYFTSATPRAMAKVFLAAGCTDAIHLDMNALEHAYAAVYDHTDDGKWTVHHLDKGMSVLDKQKKGVTLPRFVGFADNRDFFTVLRRSAP